MLSRFFDFGTVSAQSRGTLPMWCGGHAGSTIGLLVLGDSPRFECISILLAKFFDY